jgi:hypothetical protein
LCATYLAAGAVDIDDVAVGNVLLGQRFDHLCSQLIHCFHIGRLHRYFANSRATARRRSIEPASQPAHTQTREIVKLQLLCCQPLQQLPINLNFYNFSFNNFYDNHILISVVFDKNSDSFARACVFSKQIVCYIQLTTTQNNKPASSVNLTPIERRKACVNASLLLISSE